MTIAPRLVGVPAAEVDAVWPLVEPLIADACRRGGGKDAPPDIRRAVSERDQQLWLAWDFSVVALAVTEIVCHPRKKCCRIRICTGRERRSWQHQLAAIEVWAKAHGCAAMELIARTGWSRLLKSQGYALTHLYCEKEL